MLFTAFCALVSFIVRCCYILHRLFPEVTGEGQDGKTKDSKDQPKSVSGNYKFFIHYHGWNKNWDEWVAEPRILKLALKINNRKKPLHFAHVLPVKSVTG